MIQKVMSWAYFISGLHGEEMVEIFLKKRIAKKKKKKIKNSLRLKK